MYRINEEKMYYDMADGIAVVINFTTGIYYGMDELGSAAVAALLDGAGEADVLSAIKALEGCPSDIDVSFSAFMAKLKEFDILIGDGDGKQCAPFAPELAAKGFDLKCDAFSEVMDLIMADPVHDVEPEQGWPFLKEE